MMFGGDGRGSCRSRCPKPRGSVHTTVGRCAAVMICRRDRRFLGVRLCAQAPAVATVSLYGYVNILSRWLETWSEQPSTRECGAAGIV